MVNCLLCNLSKKDPRCGDFIQKGKIVVHEYCLYTSSALLTNGDENNGLYGFLPKDIHAESRRVSRLRCVYCHKYYANIGCCKSKCQRTFHTLCGMENGCLNEFIDTFRSYCNEHVKKSLRKQPPLNEMCCICYDPLRNKERFFYTNYIEAPCCRNGWFHKQCLQEFARTAGYFFKCPLCNDTKKFTEEMPYRGIFVPKRDAAWELEPNAFAELLERPSKCEADVCKNKRGRKSYNNETNPLVYCETCGSVAVHQNCLSRETNEFICKDCLTLTERTHNNEDSGRESLLVANSNDKEESEDVDVCNVSESEDDDTDFLERPFFNRKSKQDSSDSCGHTDDFILQSNSNDSRKSKHTNTQQDSSSIARKRLRYDNTAKVEEIDKGTSSNCAYTPEATYNHTQCGSSKAFSDDSDQSNDSIIVKRKNRINLIIDSLDESSGSSTDLRRVGTFKSASNFTNGESDDSANLITSTSRKRIENNNNTSFENKEINSLNVSCIANRTRRKSYSQSVFPRSDDNGSNRKIRNSSSSSSASSTDSSLSCLSNESADTQASSSSAELKNNRNVQNNYTSSNRLTNRIAKSSNDKNSNNKASLRQLRDSTSSSSVYSESSSCATTDSSVFNISCVANRTRRRKSIYYSSDEVINEES